MQIGKLATMSVDELWRLREEIDLILPAKIEAEKQELQYRLASAKPRSSRVHLHLISRTG
jgi:hypothetical protein